jgi:hypothetical protein
MPPLHEHKATRCRDALALSQEQDGSRPFGQSRRDAGTPQQGSEFFPLLRGQGNHSLTLDHGNILVQEVLSFGGVAADEVALQIAQSVLWDNGAFSLYTRGAPGYPNGSFDLVKLAGPWEGDLDEVKTKLAHALNAHLDPIRERRAAVLSKPEGLREMLSGGLPGPPAWVASIPLAGEWLEVERAVLSTIDLKLGVEPCAIAPLPSRELVTRSDGPYVVITFSARCHTFLNETHSSECQTLSGCQRFFARAMS